MKVVPIVSTRNLGKTLLLVLLFASSLTGNILTRVSHSQEEEPRSLSVSNETSFSREQVGSVGRRLFNIKELKFEEKQSEIGEYQFESFECNPESGEDNQLTCSLKIHGFEWEFSVSKKGDDSSKKILFSFQNKNGNPLHVTQKLLKSFDQFTESKIITEGVNFLKEVSTKHFNDLEFSLYKLSNWLSEQNFYQITRNNNFLMFKHTANSEIQATVSKRGLYTVISVQNGSKRMVSKFLTPSFVNQKTNIEKKIQEIVPGDDSSNSNEKQGQLPKLEASGFKETTAQDTNHPDSTQSFYTWAWESTGNENDSKRHSFKLAATLLKLHSSSLNLIFLQGDSDFKKIEGFYENSQNGRQSLEKDWNSLANDQQEITSETHKLEPEKLKKKILESCPEVQIFEKTSEQEEQQQEDKVFITITKTENQGFIITYHPLLKPSAEVADSKIQKLNLELQLAEENTIKDEDRVVGVFKEMCEHHKQSRVLKNKTEDPLTDFSFSSVAGGFENAGGSQLRFTPKNEESGAAVKIEVLKRVTFDE